MLLSFSKCQYEYARALDCTLRQPPVSPLETRAKRVQ